MTYHERATRVFHSKPHTEEILHVYSNTTTLTALVALPPPAVQRSPVQLIYIKLHALHVIVNLVILDSLSSLHYCSKHSDSLQCKVRIL